MVRRLLTINGLGILGVILFHAAGWGSVAMFAWTHRYLAVTVPDYSQMGGLSYYALRAIEQLVVFVLPAFLFVSGYFIAVAAGRGQRAVGWNTVGSRIKMLIIPYLFWSIAVWGLKLAEGKTLSPTGYLRAFLTGETNPAYYYVPLLISLYLLSPLLVHWAKTQWITLLVGTALLQLTIQLQYYPVLLGIDMGALAPMVDIVPKWFFPTRIFWFAFGIVAGFHITQFNHLLQQFRRYLITAGVFLFVAGMIEWEVILQVSGQPWLSHRETFIDTLFSLTVLLCLLAFDSFRLPFSNHVGELSSKTYGIYLVHSPTMEVVARSVYVFAPALLAYQIVLQPLLIVFGLGVPLLLMVMLSHSPLRRYYRYVFG